MPLTTLTSKIRYKEGSGIQQAYFLCYRTPLVIDAIIVEDCCAVNDLMTIQGHLPFRMIPS